KARARRSPGPANAFIIAGQRRSAAKPGRQTCRHLSVHPDHALKGKAPFPWKFLSTIKSLLRPSLSRLLEIFLFFPSYSYSAYLLVPTYVYFLVGNQMTRSF